MGGILNINGQAGLGGAIGVGIDGNGTGPDMKDQISGSTDLTVVGLTPLSYDFVPNGVINGADLDAMANAVLPLVQRALEPFDINVQIANASSLAGVATTLASNNSDTTGRFDAYCLIVAARNGSGSAFVDPLLQGRAARDDLIAQTNRQDEAVLVFADNVLGRARDSVGNLADGDPVLNASLINRIAYTATHEAFHTFGVRHTVGPGFGTTAQQLMTNGDVCRNGATSEARENPFIVTRFDLPHEDAVTQPNNYLLIRNNSDIGPRNSNGVGAPDLAYVTGTGAFDKIKLDRDATNSNLVHVTVDAYSNATFTSLIQQHTYDINLTTDTEGEILIDSSLSGDLIEIDADIAASVRIRGMLGDDQVKLHGVGASALRTLNFDGEAGNDTLTVDYQNGDPLPLASYNFTFNGGAGADNTTVIESGGTQRTGYVVDTFADADDTTAAANDQVTLRSAVQGANAASTKTYIFLPTGTYVLDIPGSGQASHGDLDLSGNMSIIGRGAGQTIINASGLSNRVFDINNAATLDVFGVTLTGAHAQTDGGAILVDAGGELILTECAIVGNSALEEGGGIYVAMTGKATIKNSVITENTASAGGGGIHLNVFSGTAGKVTIGGTIVVNNTGPAAPDVFAEGAPETRSFTSRGYNLLGNTANGLTSDAYGDYFKPSGTTVQYVVTNAEDNYDGTADKVNMSARDAIHQANINPGPQEIWLPAWRHRLTRSGTESTSNTTFNDLDILSGEVKIRGAGPGLTVIDASTLAIHDRVFDVANQGILDLSRVTIALGYATNSGGALRYGGGVRVQNGGQFKLDYSAIVGNLTGRNGEGGGVYFGATATGSIKNSVITVNTADDEGGGLYLATGSGGAVTLENTIIANNSDYLGTYPDVVVGSGRTLDSLGYNRFTSVTEGPGFTLEATDYVIPPGQTVHYVVTSVSDTFDGTADPVSMTIRDAIHQANVTAGLQELWLPAWKHVLTRDRITYGTQGSPFDTEVSFGDLDILGSLIIRGIGPIANPLTTVGWAPGLADNVFELVGDYNLDNLVQNGGADLAAWQSGSPNADGNDDGFVNSLDQAFYQMYAGNTLLVDRIG